MFKRMYEKMLSLQKSPRSKMSSLRLVPVVLFYPLETFDIIKRERETKFRILPAILLILSACIMKYSYAFLVSFQLEEKDTTTVNIWFEFGMIVVPIIVWAVSSFCMSSILSGESKLHEIFMASAYCLVPYIIMSPLLGILSHILSYSESGIFSFLKMAVLVWVLILLFLSMMRLNDYRFLKAVWVTILAVIFMVLILAVLILLIALSIQLVISVLDFIEEIQLKYIY